MNRLFSISKQLRNNNNRLYTSFLPYVIEKSVVPRFILVDQFTSEFHHIYRHPGREFTIFTVVS